MPESKPLVSFQAACFVSLRPSPVPPLFFCLPSPLKRRHPRSRSHQWFFLLFSVNIQKVSLFIYCISAITDRFCWGCVKHATMGSHYRSLSRSRREMFNLTLTSCSVCLSPTHNGLCFKLYNAKKKNNNNDNNKTIVTPLLTASQRRCRFIKD